METADRFAFPHQPFPVGMEPVQRGGRMASVLAGSDHQLGDAVAASAASAAFRTD